MNTQFNKLLNEDPYQRKLSDVNGDFLEYIKTHPEGLKRESFKELELNSQLFTLQPWPTFVSRKYIDEFRTASEAIWKLFKTIPRRIFNYDSTAMSRFYRLPRNVFDIQMQGVTDETLEHLVSRGDFIISRDGLKCLEYNVTPNLGGWQISIWESLYRRNSFFSRFLKQHRIETFNQNLFVQFLNHIIRLNKGEASDAAGGELNIVFTRRKYDENASDPARDYLDSTWRRLLEKEFPGRQGRVFFCDMKRLHLDGQRLCLDGRVINTMVEFQHGLVNPMVLTAFKAKKLKLLNGPVCQLLGGKLNLALLSDYERYDVYDSREKELIDRYIPWSRKVEPGKTTFHSSAIDMEPFLRENREILVLKPSRGLGGEDVFVGAKTSQDTWENAINDAMAKGNFLVQEFVEGDRGIYQTDEEGCHVHDMVWGFFLFGNTYSGAWVRVMPSMGHKGVINCHQGATVSGIFEVEN